MPGVVRQRFWPAGDRSRQLDFGCSIPFGRVLYWPVARDRCLSRFGRLLLFQNDFLRLLIVSPTKKGRLPQLVVSGEFCVFDFTD